MSDSKPGSQPDIESFGSSGVVTSEVVDRSVVSADAHADADSVDSPAAVAASDAAEGPLLPDVALAAQVEALLFISSDGLTEERMAAAIGVTVSEVTDAIEALGETLAGRSSGLMLRRLSTGWRLTTAPSCAPLLERFVVEGQSGRLSPAALETLAVVAYRQPVSRGRIAAIRGVAVDGVVRTLLTRGLIEEVGMEPSGAVLYAVTSLFLDRLGVADVTELPSLAPLLPDIETLNDDHDQHSISAADFSHQIDASSDPDVNGAVSFDVDVDVDAVSVAASDAELVEDEGLAGESINIAESSEERSLAELEHPVSASGASRTSVEAAPIAADLGETS